MKTAFIIWFALVALCAAFATGCYVGYLAGQNAPSRIYQPPKVMEPKSIKPDSEILIRTPLCIIL